MTDNAKTELEQLQYAELRRYRNVLPLQLELDAVSRLLEGEKLDSRACLEISAGSGMVSRLLREMGGTWHSVAGSTESVERIKAMVGENAGLINEDGTLPFDDKTFDVVVVASEHFATVADDERFVMACHRVLKDGGIFICCCRRLKRIGLIPYFRRMLGVTAEDLGLRRQGYSEKQLFELLRSGFDVHEMRSYQRFFVELVQAMRQRRELHMAGGGGRGLLFRLAYQLDMVICFTRGYMLASRSRRRTWRSRTLPGLAVGGSISSAVLARPGV